MYSSFQSHFGLIITLLLSTYICSDFALLSIPFLSDFNKYTEVIPMKVELLLIIILLTIHLKVTIGHWYPWINVLIELGKFILLIHYMKKCKYNR